MSDETRRALDEAIRAHVAAEYDDPTIVTDYVVLTAVQSIDADSTRYFYEVREGMSWHVLIGLIRWFLSKFERGRAWRDDE